MASEQSKRLNALVAHLPAKLFIGVNDGERMYLSRPSFDCDWYWGFGYVGNRNCHYHLSGIGEGQNINYFDAIKRHFGDSFVIKDDRLIWQFAELVRTIYTLKSAAETFNRGGSNYTTNPAADIVKRSDLESEIIEKMLPRLYEELYKTLGFAV